MHLRVIGLVSTAVAVAIAWGGCGAILGIEDLSDVNLGGGGAGGGGFGGEVTSCDELEDWSLSIGGPNDQEDIYLAPIPDTYDVFVAGTFAGSVDVGDGPHEAQDQDFFVARLAPGGRPVWSRKFGGAGDQLVRGIAVDEEGSIYLMGYYEGNIAFGDPTSPIQHTSGEGGMDLFVAKLDIYGDAVWALSSVQVGPMPKDVCDPTRGGIVVNYESVFVYAVASGVESQLFGSDALPVSYDGGLLLLQMTRDDGTPEWGRVFNSSYYACPGGIAAIADGTVTIGGSFSGELNFSDTPGEIAVGAENVDDVFLAQFDPGGGVSYAFGLGGPGLEVASAVALDDGFRAALVGRYRYDSFSMTEPFPTARPYENEDDAFVVVIDGDGESGFADGFFGGGDQVLTAVTFDGQETVVAGRLDESFEAAGTPVGASASGADVFLLALSPDGNYRWDDVFDGDGFQEPLALAPDGCGGYYIAGVNGGSVDFGQGALESVGGNDLFVARVSDN